MIINLLGPVVAFGAALAAFLLEHAYHDKRTVLHRRAKVGFLITMGVSLVVGIFATFINYEDQRETDALLKDIQSRAELSEASEKSALAKLGELQERVHDLQGTLDPFVGLAVQMFPNVERDRALNMLLDRVKTLEQEVSSLDKARKLAIETEAADAVRRATPPQVDAHLAVSEKGNLFTVIDLKNSIPIRARWVVVTKHDQIVSGLMLAPVELFPSGKAMPWKYKEDPQSDKVIDEYLELRLDYESVYFAERGRPPALAGKLIKKYRFSSGRLYPVDG